MSIPKKCTLFVTVVVLLAMVIIGVAFGVETHTGSNHSEHHGLITTSHKALESLCRHTDYKTTCRKSLANVNKDDPKELVKVAFNYAIKELRTVLDSSYALQELAKDVRTSMALALCKEALNNSIDDLKRSLEKLANFNVTFSEEDVDDLKIWLSGSLTYQETCREGFNSTTGDILGSFQNSIL